MFVYARISTKEDLLALKDVFHLYPLRMLDTMPLCTNRNAAERRKDLGIGNAAKRQIWQWH